MELDFDPSSMDPAMYYLTRIDVMQRAIDDARKRKRCQDCMPEFHLIPHVFEEEGFIRASWMCLELHDRSCPGWRPSGS